MKYTGNREVDAILSSKLSPMDAANLFCKVEGVLPAALADVRSGTVNLIIVKDMSRLGRNYLEAGWYLEELRA